MQISRNTHTVSPASRFRRQARRHLRHSPPAYAPLKRTFSRQASAIRKRRRDMLRQSTLKAGFMSAWVWDVDSNKAYYSIGLMNSVLIGLSPEDTVLGSDLGGWMSWFHEGDRELVAAAFDAVRRGRSNEVDVVARLRRADGVWSWIILRGTLEQGTRHSRLHRYCVGVLIDVSHLRLDDRFFPWDTKLAGNYKAMLDNSPDMIIRSDKDLLPLYINPATRRFIPTLPEDFNNRRPSHLDVDEKTSEFVKSHILRVFAEGSTLKCFWNFTSPPGEPIPVECTFWPERNPSGEVVTVMAQIRDVSSQVKFRQSADLNEMRFSAIYQLTQMDDAPDEEVLSFVVESVSKLTGSEHSFIFLPSADKHARAGKKSGLGKTLGPGKMVWSKSHLNFLRPDELPSDHIPPGCLNEDDLAMGPPGQDMIVNGHGAKTPLYKTFSDRVPIYRVMRAAATENGQVTCLVAVCNKNKAYEESDLQQLRLFISSAWLLLRRRKYLEDLKKAKDGAEAAGKVKDRFLANISHELRTPLNGMLSMLQLLELSNLDEEQMEYARAAVLSGKALLRIISDILDFSRMESGKMSLQIAPFNLGQTLSSTLNLFGWEAVQKDLKLTLDMDQQLSDPNAAQVLGDEARLRQIIFNLVGNSLKFTDKGSITVHCSLLPQSTDGIKRFYISVSDTGIGIAEKDHLSIFTSFTQIDNDRNRRLPGTGLGLGIVRRLIHMMNGSLTIESQEGKGTVMHMSLGFPLAPRQDEHPPADYGQKKIARPPLTVLVAEDDPVSQFALGAFLKKAGHMHVGVGNGRQAMEALLLYPFDCLITDIQMPELDGMEVVQRIRSGDCSGISPTPEVRALLFNLLEGERAHTARDFTPGDALAAKDDECPAQEHAGQANGHAGCGGLIPKDLPVVAVSAHAMSGDRERFLRHGMSLYISKPISAMDLDMVLESVYACKELSSRA